MALISPAVMAGGVRGASQLGVWLFYIVSGNSAAYINDITKLGIDLGILEGRRHLGSSYFSLVVLCLLF